MFLRYEAVDNLRNELTIDLGKKNYDEPDEKYTELFISYDDGEISVFVSEKHQIIRQ